MLKLYTVAVVAMIVTYMPVLTLAAASASDMGPAAFMWPPDRTWSAAWDNVAPCGSNASIGNRTGFPLSNGAIALVIQDEAYNVQVGLSWDSNPDENSDFDVVISNSRISEVDPGHQCFSIPAVPSNISAGDVGTLQIKYTADMDSGINGTYYACADILYVNDSDFESTIPCFNVSIEDPTAVTSSSIQVTASATSSSKSTTTSNASKDVSGNSNNGLTKGAIAGIVLGVFFGVAIVAVAAFMMRKRQKRLEKALAAEIRMRDIDAKSAIPDIH